MNRDDYQTDRCATCRQSIRLDWSAYGCPCGAVVTCAGCDPVEACGECRRAEGVA